MYMYNIHNMYIKDHVFHLKKKLICIYNVSNNILKPEVRFTCKKYEFKDKYHFYKTISYYLLKYYEKRIYVCTKFKIVKPLLSINIIFSMYIIL